MGAVTVELTNLKNADLQFADLHSTPKKFAVLYDSGMSLELEDLQICKIAICEFIIKNVSL
jgi:hypothetical protein